MGILVKALIGALVVVLIGLLAKSRSYYIAGLVPLFPTFALIAHYIVGSETFNRGTENHADFRYVGRFALPGVSDLAVFLYQQHEIVLGVGGRSVVLDCRGVALDYAMGMVARALIAPRLNYGLPACNTKPRCISPAMRK